MQRKPIFDTVRAMLGRGFKPHEVAALDAAITSAARPDDPDPDPFPVAVSERGIALIKQFEGCARKARDGMMEAYPDPGTGGEPWTIGWGTTGPDIKKGMRWDQDRCDRRLVEDVARHAQDVVRALEGAPTTQNQFDAMVSFHYNTGAIGRATLTRRHKAGEHEAAAAEFLRWNKAGGRVLAGLTRRRAEEARLYRS